MSMTDTDAARFFYEHAGYSWNRATETEEEGRWRCARALAAAESRLKAGPYFIGLEPDPEPWDADVPYDGPVWIVGLYSVADSIDGEIMGSLGGVAATGWNDPYVRVVSAELADEHIKED